MTDLQEIVKTILSRAVKSPPTFHNGNQMVQISRSLFSELERTYRLSIENDITKDEIEESIEDDWYSIGLF